MTEISGIPQIQNENCEELVLKIGEKINVALEEKDFEASHRISSKEGSAIIVKLKSRKIREVVLSKQSKAAAKRLTVSDLGFTIQS